MQEEDGAWSLSDAQVMGLFDRVIRDGHGDIFSDGTIDTREKFLSAMKNTSRLYVSVVKGDLAAIFWLNRFEGRTARVHYCTFSGVSYGDKIRMAKHAVKTLLNMRMSDGSYAIDTLVSYIPTRRRLALRYNLAVGGIPIGKIPKLIWNGETGKSEEGLISYFERESDENL